MPSHIFTRLGYWQESIDSNTVGVAANKAAMADNHPPGTAFEGALHGTDYMMYAHLQLGQDEAARAFIDEVNSIERVLGGFGAAYALSRHARPLRDGTGRVGRRGRAHPPPAFLPVGKLPARRSHHGCGTGREHAARAGRC